MTKLTPIEELAKQVGLMDNEGNLLVHCEPSEKENRELDADILKAFRQAIISDFVSKLEPVGYCEKSQIEDVKDGGTGLFFDIKDEPYSTPLFDLTEWITK